MIVDSSAIISILKGESDSKSLMLTIVASKRKPSMSAANYVETAMVVDRLNDSSTSRRLDSLLDEMGITIEPVSIGQARIAREAFKEFGKGSGHPAQLNFGDCFAYALSREKREPLLFKGNDFTQTDVDVATILEY